MTESRFQIFACVHTRLRERICDVTIQVDEATRFYPHTYGRVAPVLPKHKYAYLQTTMNTVSRLNQKRCAKRPFHRCRGFTLIELLVVIAIIAILSSLILTSFGEIRLKSRDAKRLSDLREIEKALALYYDNNGSFPIAVSTVTITSEDAVSSALEGDVVISNVPTDPLHDTYTYTYQSDPAGIVFTLSFCLEGDSIPNFSQGCGNTITP